MNSIRSEAAAPSLLKHLFLNRFEWRIIIVLCSLAATTCGLSAPYFQKSFVDAMVGGNSSIQFLIFAFLFMVGFQCFQQLTLYLAIREAVFYQKWVSETLYRKLVDHRGGLNEKNSSGEAVSLFAVDVAGASLLVENCLATGFSMFFPLITAPFLVHVLFGIPFINVFVVLIISCGITSALAVRQSKFFVNFKRLAAERTGKVSEWVQTIRTLRILGWMEAVEERIFEVRRKETENRIKMVTNGQTMNSLSGVAPYFVNLAAVITLAAMKKEAITAGEILSLLWILGVFLNQPLRQYPWFFVMGMDGLTSIRRLQAALNRKVPDPVVKDSPASRVPEQTALEVNGLNLTIQNKKLLDNVSFHVKEGEFLGMVGEVGSGKSLILLSLVGETGAVFDRYTFRGEKIASPDSEEVKSHFAFIQQDGFTISASLRDNVAFQYNQDHSTDDSIARSLKLSQFVATQEGLSSGLNEEIGERGVNLSGGQRQRIGIARAHFAGRPILLLDDCLSAVDVETERGLIRDLIAGEWKNQTRVLVTHRMSVLPHTDRILFIEDGKILQEGKYDELIATSEKFRNFVLTNQKKDEEVSKTVEKEKAMESVSNEEVVDVSGK